MRLEQCLKFSGVSAVLCATLFFPAHAQVQAFPPRLVFSETKRVKEMVVKAPEGVAGETYRVEAVLFEMNDTGKLRELSEAEAKKAPQSIISMLRFSPREFKLNGGQSQVVRFRILPAKPPAPGLYRAHVRIVPVSGKSVVDGAKKENVEKGISLDLRMKLALAVPVYYHHSYAFPKVTLSAPVLQASAVGDVPQVEAWMEPKEEQPVYGDFYIVTGEVKNFAESDPAIVGILRGLASYGKKRRVQIPFLDAYKGKKIEALTKSYKLQFRKTLEEGADLIAEVVLKP